MLGRCALGAPNDCVSNARRLMLRSLTARLLVTWLLAAWLLAGLATPAKADDTSDPRLLPTSEQYAREEARKAIPWTQLTPANQRRVRHTVRNASVYRRLPTCVVPCNPQVFDFLIRRPEVVTSVWNLMGISQLTIDRESDSVFRAVDQLGAKGRTDVVYSQHDEEARGVTVAVIDGLYQQKPMPRPLNAQCVLLLRSGSTVESNGQTYITARVDAFVKFERVTADLVARGLQPLLVQTADHNFQETMKFISTFSRTAERDPSGMRHLAERLTSIDDPTRSELVEVCSLASEQAAARAAARAAEQVRLAQLRAGDLETK